MFWKAKSKIIVFNEATMHIYWREEGFSIFKTCNNEVVVEWILLVSFLVADSAEVISVVFNCEVDAIVEWFWFSCKFIHFSGDLLKIWVLASCGQNDSLCKLLDSVNIRIFLNLRMFYLGDLRMKEECRLRLLYPLCTWQQWWLLLRLLDWQHFRWGCFPNGFVLLTFKLFLKKYQI